jgi:hypothetical protein
MSIPFPLGAVCRASYLDHGHVVVRRRERVVRIDELLSWFDAVLDGRGLMTLLLHAWWAVAVVERHGR